MKTNKNPTIPTTTPPINPLDLTIILFLFTCVLAFMAFLAHDLFLHHD